LIRRLFASGLPFSYAIEAYPCGEGRLAQLG